MKILCVEDGSVDIDILESEGLKDGQILVYRQGARPPFVLSLDNEYYDDKWHKLKEFIIKKQEEYQADIIEEEMQGSIPKSISFYARCNLCNEIQKKMQELEGENE